MSGMRSGLARFLDALSERQDLVLAVFIVSVIFMLILPLPTALIDVLIGFNLAIAVVLLMVAVYLSTPLDFSAFPAVLLITTLFRLALSISTTRLILLQADAGRIVEAFGGFVVGGNLVVGLVIFLILAIVQFIVITKGAERVAEVSARFSLDALPGKQLSIDADMRAGAIDLDDARELRNRIQRESKLYGSMDGAMKFVKGDAIATLIIVFVNLLGGLGIGMLQRDLSFSEAIGIYSILTIGDGLVAQIPALFISITAGIMVTRVTDERQRANLGRDIGHQIGSEPRALLVAAGMLFVLAFIPGFPAVTLATLGLVIGVPALVLLLTVRRTAAAAAAETPSQTPAKLAVRKGAEKFVASRDPLFAPTVGLLVELAPDIAALADAAARDEKLNTPRVTLYYRLGISLPAVEVKVNDKLAAGAYRIFVSEIPAADGVAEAAGLFVFDRTENLEINGIEWRGGDPFLPNRETLWVDGTRAADLDAAGIVYKKPLDLVCYHCEVVFSKYAPLFVGVQEAKNMMAQMETMCPDLVKEVQRALPIQSIAELLQRLVQEYISVRDLRQIFGAIVEWGAKEKDPILLVEHIRTALSRQISYQYCLANNMLPVFMLDSEIEESIRNGIRQTSAASYLSLDPELSRRMVANIRKAVEPSIKAGNTPVLLTAMDVRRYLRRMIESELPELPVLSYQELTPEISMQPLGRITM